jgi:hypothetical protein
MSKVDELTSEIREVMRAQLLGEMSEDDSARLIILLQCEIISELTAMVKEAEKRVA